MRNELVRPTDATGPGGVQLLPKISGLMRSIGRSTNPPTAAQQALIDPFEQAMNGIVERFTMLIEERLAALNRRMNEANIPRVG